MKVYEAGDLPPSPGGVAEEEEEGGEEEAMLGTLRLQVYNDEVVARGCAWRRKYSEGPRMTE